MTWQKKLALGFRDPKALLAYLGHDDNACSALADQLFRTRVPLSFVNKMNRNSLSCPLLKQVLPLALELNDVEGFIRDPLKENTFNVLPGLLHKYHGRVLITLAGSCAINCRYCFRRHFSYEDNQINLTQWDKIIAYLQKNPSLNEVIFSGGDPLMVQTKRLAHYLESLEAITHIKTVRFHTRMPIVLPERIDDDFITLMKNTRLLKVMVVHSNHENELCEQTKAAFDSLKQSGVMLLNQSVLLNEINDEVEVLVKLSRKLFEQGVMPYYLHLPDKVKATSHFDVTLAKARKLHKQMQALLPGYLVPRLVQEVPGEKHKTLIIQ